MDNLLLAAALLSALLHAAWNAAVRAHPDAGAVMTAQMVGAALLALPALAVVGLPGSAAAPWVLASTALNVLAVHALLKAYATGPFGLVYPLVRASSVLLVLPLAAVVVQESPRPMAVAGVGVIAGAVLLLAFGVRGVIGHRGWAWLAVAAATGAGYIVCDAQGARAGGSAVAYGLCVTVTNALGRLAVGGRTAWPAARAAASHWRWGLGLGAVSTLSYLLILWVYARAPVAPASALRDTSALWAVLIAVVVLRERLEPKALLAVALACGGCVLIRLA